MKYKILLWGTGTDYNKNYNGLKYFEITKQLEIIGITADKVPNVKKIDGYRIIDKTNIKNIEFDYVVVMSSKYFFEIKEILNSMNIEDDRILSLKFIFIPHLNLENYIFLKKSNISIISNNCWGGIVYKTLGFECRSPFKNLFLEDIDYLKLLRNFSYYMRLEPVFKRNEKDFHSGIMYPVLELGDIEIHCNHAQNEKEAINDWKRRREKINYNSLCVEMYATKRESVKQFCELKQYSNKICFTPYKYGYNEEIQLELMPGQREFLEAVNSSAGIGRNSYIYNVVDLLCQKYESRIVY